MRAIWSGRGRGFRAVGSGFRKEEAGAGLAPPPPPPPRRGGRGGERVVGRGGGGGGAVGGGVRLAEEDGLVFEGDAGFEVVEDSGDEVVGLLIFVEDADELGFLGGLAGAE